MSAADLVRHIDLLYERAVTDPAAIDEAALIDWTEVAADASGGDREQAKSIRRAVRTARKLARYWVDRDPSALPEWRNGVDEALGGLGWRAQLDLLMASLEQQPDPETFELAKERHRAVHFTEWMEGVSYEEWLAAR